MCRINGVLCFNTVYVGKDLFSTGIQLRDKLAHGGPDDAGAFYDEEDAIFLGHRRLSILDVLTIRAAAFGKLSRSSNVNLLFNSLNTAAFRC